MTVKYEVDGNIFREINEKWPFAYVGEYLIKAHVFDMDQSGNKIETFQLNDGRLFTRVLPEAHTSVISKESRTGKRIPHRVPLGVGDQSITQPR